MMTVTMTIDGRRTTTTVTMLAMLAMAMAAAMIGR